jgi:hypothetical protein
MTKSLASDTNLLYQGIGKVIVEFQFIEHVLAEILASLLQMRHPADTHRITAAMSYGQKVDLMCDLYLDRRNPGWPVIDLQINRNALKAAEEFRNTVAHSFWHVDGADPKWMRTKAHIRSKSRLVITVGAVNFEALDEGAKSLYVVRDWYLGQTERISDATAKLRSLTKKLSLAVDEINTA